MNWFIAWILMSIGAGVGYFACALMTIAKEADKHIPEGEP